MRDQATNLRHLLDRRGDAPTDDGSARAKVTDAVPSGASPELDARRVAGELAALRGGMEPVSIGPRGAVIAITSGKGGVGKSLITLNLAVALALRGKRVCVLDANPGLGNIDLMCGLSGYWNLSHVATGSRTVGEVLLEGPRGIHIVPGAGALEALRELSPELRRETLDQLTPLEQEHNFLLIDTGTGLPRDARRIVGAADRVLVVATPEPMAIADAYATVKSLCALPESPEPLVLANLAETPFEGRDVLARIQGTALSFLHREIGSAGVVPRDPVVPASLRQRVPFVLSHPDAPASRAIAQLARLIAHTSRAREGRPFFGRFQREN
jgi:flagellar biosynthesis protein FlhG